MDLIRIFFFSVKTLWNDPLHSPTRLKTIEENMARRLGRQFIPRTLHLQREKRGKRKKYFWSLVCDDEMRRGVIRLLLFFISKFFSYKMIGVFYFLRWMRIRKSASLFFVKSCEMFLKFSLMEKFVHSCLAKCVFMMRKVMRFYFRSFVLLAYYFCRFRFFFFSSRSVSFLSCCFFFFFPFGSSSLIFAGDNLDARRLFSSNVAIFIDKKCTAFYMTMVVLCFPYLKVSKNSILAPVPYSPCTIFR